MTLLLRLIALGSAFISFVFFAMPIMIWGHGTSPVRDTLASIIFVLFGILAARCTRWLWRRKRFWTEPQSLSEVAALSCAAALWPIMALLEHRTRGLAKDSVHVSFLLLTVAGYVVARRYGTNSAAHASDA